MHWRKSSHSGSSQSNCVELAAGLDAVRDAKDPHGPVLAADLRAFLADVRSGRYDRELQDR